MITREELHERQGWSYEQKIDHSLFIIDTFIHRNNGKVFMVLGHDAQSAVLLDLVWRIERSISGVYPEREKGHIADYGGSPIYPDMASSRWGEEQYLKRGQCATYEEDGAPTTEAHPLSIWCKADIAHYLQDRNDLRRIISIKDNPNK